VGGGLGLADRRVAGGAAPAQRDRQHRVTAAAAELAAGCGPGAIGGGHADPVADPLDLVEQMRGEEPTLRMIYQDQAQIFRASTAPLSARSDPVKSRNYPLNKAS
jgi:hypothetical protein